MPTVMAGPHEVTLTVEGGAEWTPTLTTTSTLEPGVEEVRVRLAAASPVSPPRTVLSWAHPIVDIHGAWFPGADRNRALRPDFAPGFSSRATSQAPVFTAFSLSGQNRLTFAFSDALNAVQIRGGVHEESAELHCSLTLFSEPVAPLDLYEATLRIDTRDVPYYQCLRDVAGWWASLPGYEPAAVPEAARVPLYSTWYSFHQAVSPEEIERQCALAAPLGMELVIVDDGWQTANNQRGYAYTGDWQVAPEKVPDIRAHVERVHALGMRYALWYSVPFVGSFSKAFQRFQGKFLSIRPDFFGTGGQVAVFDPRFPEVREYLIGLYEQAVRDWDVDGFKLDFVDSFTPREDRMPPGMPRPTVELGGGRDYDSVPAAVDRLLTDARTRLEELKPGVFVEFRQSYVGPLMRKYGHMFRAGDCPNDAVTNRVRTIDVRLLCGSTAAHADPLMWHSDDPVESAALQILNTLFAVPQISVRLDSVPAAHVEMLAHWLGFWRANRDVLLDGDLRPLHPESLYPVVIASTPSKRVVAVYQDTPVSPGDDVPIQLYLVNGTLGDRLVLELEKDLGERYLEVSDTRGRIVRAERIGIGAGLHSIDVPPAGLVSLRA